MLSCPLDHNVSASSCHEPEELETGRSFLQALTSSKYSPKQENAAIYIHPLVKMSSAKLSEKSLEMCTESLGSETGSDDIMEETTIASYNSPLHPKETKIILAKSKREYNFPPPLSSLSDSVSMKSHRENGRIVMKAVVFVESSNSSLFQAERINGRLKLQLKKDGREEIEEN